MEYGRHVGHKDTSDDDDDDDDDNRDIINYWATPLYTPTSNTASHDTTRKKQLTGFNKYGAPLGGPSECRSSAMKHSGTVAIATVPLCCHWRK